MSWKKYCYKIYKEQIVFFFLFMTELAVVHNDQYHPKQEEMQRKICMMSPVAGLRIRITGRSFHKLCFTRVADLLGSRLFLVCPLGGEPLQFNRLSRVEISSRKGCEKVLKRQRGGRNSEVQIYCKKV